MIDLEEIQLWKTRLELEEPSWKNYERLAVLYAIEDRQSGERPYPAYSTAAPVEQLSDYGDSEFLQTIRGKDPAQAWAVMDELMDTMRIVNERVYNSVMRKLDSL